MAIELQENEMLLEAGRLDEVTSSTFQPPATLGPIPQPLRGAALELQERISHFEMRLHEALDAVRRAQRDAEKLNQSVETVPLYLDMEG